MKGESGRGADGIMQVIAAATGPLRRAAELGARCRASVQALLRARLRPLLPSRSRSRSRMRPRPLLRSRMRSRMRLRPLLRSRMRSRMRLRPLLPALLVACAPALGPVDAPSPLPEVPAAPARPEQPRLPSVPAVDGPLAVDVVHPPEDEQIGVDSTFIFGSVGSGRATLTINGAPVQVAPNGAFLAFLPVPADGVYRLVATRDGEQATLERRISRPAAAVRSVTGTQIVPGSVYPRGTRTVLEGESVEVGFRGTAGGRAELVLPTGERFPLVEREATAPPPPGAQFIAQQPVAPAAPAPPQTGAQRVAQYAGSFPARALATPDTAIAAPTLVAARPRAAAEARRDSLIERCAAAVAAGQPAHELPDCTPVAVDVAARVAVAAAPAAGARVELIIGGDTARAPLPLNLATLEAGWTRVGVATFPGDEDVPWDWTIRGRNFPTGPFHYFWPHGTHLTITGERDGFYRVRLADGLDAWAPAADMRLLPAGAASPQVVVGSARFRAAGEHIELRVPLGRRLPFHVQMEDARTLDVFIYGATSAANFFQYGLLDPLVESAEWRQPATGVFQVRVRLRQPVWGYLPYYDDADAFVLRLRRPPGIDPGRPLAGLLVAVDPGHPPGGATGPTRLTEADANLFISLRLRPMLEAAGAQVLMIREDTSTVPLGDRPRMSTEQDAHVFVSVHNNAFPDGVNPFLNHGTSMYYYFPHSVDLAQWMQREILAELVLPDIGIGRADLAVVRQTWMPAVLTESTFMMFPEQEAALRDARVQERLARAHVRALEAFLRGRAAWQR
jgi:N-acetylmuramoyl-L-alanine amidase